MKKTFFYFVALLLLAMTSFYACKKEANLTEDAIPQKTDVAAETRTVNCETSFLPAGCSPATPIELFITLDEFPQCSLKILGDKVICNGVFYFTNVRLDAAGSNWSNAGCYELFERMLFRDPNMTVAEHEAWYIDYKNERWEKFVEAYFDQYTPVPAGLVSVNLIQATCFRLCSDKAPSKYYPNVLKEVNCGEGCCKKSFTYNPHTKTLVKTGTERLGDCSGPSGTCTWPWSQCMQDCD